MIERLLVAQLKRLISFIDGPMTDAVVSLGRWERDNPGLILVLKSFSVGMLFVLLLTAALLPR